MNSWQLIKANTIPAESLPEQPEKNMLLRQNQKSRSIPKEAAFFVVVDQRNELSNLSQGFGSFASLPGGCL
jgi:hypothetical protein